MEKVKDNIKSRKVGGKVYKPCKISIYSSYDFPNEERKNLR